MFFDNYDTPVFRPPSEANSFILRVTYVPGRTLSGADR